MSSMRRGVGHKASGAAVSVCGEGDAVAADVEVSASHSDSCRQAASAGGDGEVVSVAPPFCHAEVSDEPPGPAPPAAASTRHSGDLRFSATPSNLVPRSVGAAMHADAGAGAGGVSAAQGADGKFSLKRRRDDANHAERDCLGAALFQQQGLQQGARKESISAKLVTSSNAGGGMEDYYKKKLQALQKKFQVELKVKDRMHDMTEASLQGVSSQLESLQSVHADAVEELASLSRHHRDLQAQLDSPAAVEEQQDRLVARLQAVVEEQEQARGCAERKCQQLICELQGKDRELSMKLKEVLAGKSFKWKDMVAKEKKKQKKAITALESELQKSKALAIGANSKLKAAQQKLEETGQALDVARAGLKAGAKAEKQVKALKLSHEKERASLKAAKEELLLLRKQMQAYEKSQDERAADLKKEHDQELAGLQKLHSDECNSLREELQSSRRMHEVTLASFLHTKEGEFLNLRQESGQRVALLVKEHEKGTAELQAAHRVEVEAMMGRLKKAEDKLLETLTLLADRTLADDETQSKVKMYETQLGVLGREMQEAQNLQKRSDEHVAALQKRIVTLEKDIERLEAVLDQRDEILRNHDRVGVLWQAAIEEAQNAIAEVRESAAKTGPSVHMLHIRLSSLQRENEELKSQLEFSGPLKEVLASVTKQKEDLEAALESAVTKWKTLEWTVRRHEEALASTEEKLLSLENENEDLKARMSQETLSGHEPKDDSPDPEASPASVTEDTSMEVPDSEDEDEEYFVEVNYDSHATLESPGGAQSISVAGRDVADIKLVGEGFDPSISDVGGVSAGSVCSVLEIEVDALGSVPSTSDSGAVAAGSVPSSADLGAVAAGFVTSTSDIGVVATSSVPYASDLGSAAAWSFPSTSDIVSVAVVSVLSTLDAGVVAAGSSPSTTDIGAVVANSVAAGSVPSSPDIGVAAACSVPSSSDIGLVAAGSVPSISHLGEVAASTVPSTSDIGVAAAGSVPSISHLGEVAASPVPATSDIGVAAAGSVPSISDLGEVAAGPVPATSDIGVAAASSVPSTPETGVSAAVYAHAMEPQVWLDPNFHPEIEPVTADIRDIRVAAGSLHSREVQILSDPSLDPQIPSVTTEGAPAGFVHSMEGQVALDPSEDPQIVPVTTGIQDIKAAAGSLEAQVSLDINANSPVLPAAAAIQDCRTVAGAVPSIASKVLLHADAGPVSVLVTAEMQDSGGGAVSVSDSEAGRLSDSSKGPQLASLPVTVDIPGNGNPVGAVLSNTGPASALISERLFLSTEGSPEGAWLNLETVQTIISDHDAILTGEVLFRESEPPNASLPSAPEYKSSDTRHGAIEVPHVADAEMHLESRGRELEPPDNSLPSAPEYTSSETLHGASEVPHVADAEMHLESRGRELEPPNTSLLPSAPEYTLSQTASIVDAGIAPDAPQIVDSGQDLGDTGAIAAPCELPAVDGEVISISALQELAGYYTEMESTDAEDAGKNTGAHPSSELCPKTVMHQPGPLDPYSVCSDIIPYRPVRIECSIPCPPAPKLSLRSLKRKARRLITDDSSRSAKMLVLRQ